MTRIKPRLLPCLEGREDHRAPCSGRRLGAGLEESAEEPPEEEPLAEELPVAEELGEVREAPAVAEAAARTRTMTSTGSPHRSPPRWKSTSWPIKRPRG